MEKSMSVINLMPSTKKEVVDFVAKVKSEIMNQDPIVLAVQMKAIDEVLKKLRADKEVRDYIVDEIQKYGKDMTLNGNLVTTAEAGTKWDYQGDEMLQKLLDQEAKLKIKIKGRQELLQKGLSELPAIKSSTTTYKITLK